MHTTQPRGGGTLPPLPAEGIRRFGKYFLVRKLAEGGMAEIFLAKQVGAEGFERNVVVKRMLAHLSSLPDFVGMFLDEARLAARLAHPNIVQINDLGVADGCYYIGMEYLAGEDFSTIVRTAAAKGEYVPLTVVLRIMIDASHGLHFAHEFQDENGERMNIVHRDISPSNILVTYAGQAKVLDFGIARAESRITQTTAGVVKGKYLYMAPEQARGETVDQRADVFSLGVCLYESLTNTRPFHRDNDLAVLNAVLKSEFHPPKRLRPDLPDELNRIVMKAMSGNVETRYQTAGQLAHDIEAFMNSATTSGSGGAHVANYLKGAFGDEHIGRKTKIPSLKSLHKAGVAIPGYNPNGNDGGEFEITDAAAPVVKEPASKTSVPTVVQASSSATPVAPGPASRTDLHAATAAKGNAIGFAAGGVGLLLIGAAAAFVFRPQAPPPVAPVAAEVASAPAAVPPTPTSPVTTAAAPASDATGAATAQPAVAATPVVAQPAALEPPKRASPAPSPSKRVTRGPVQLGVAEIQKVVARGRAPIMKCFETYRDDLPNQAGQVAVQFTILGSGKVTGASVNGPMAGTKVAKCLEGRVAALRFPAHKDAEISLALPFAFQVK